MAFSAPVSGVITQTGRDINLSGLSVNGGVTITTDAGVTYYDFGNNRLLVEGSISHDPEKEVAIFHHISTSTTTPTFVLSINNSVNAWGSPQSWSKDATGLLVLTKAAHGLQVGDAIKVRLNGSTTSDGRSMDNRLFRISAATTDTMTLESSAMFSLPTTVGQYQRRPCYNYGKVITNRGRTRYATGTGLIFSGNSITNWDPDEYSLNVGADGFFWGRGGVISTQRPFSLGGYYDIAGTEFVSTRTGSTVEIRSMGSGIYEGGALVNIAGISINDTLSFNATLKQASITEVLGSWYEVSIKNFDVSQNANPYDIGFGAPATHHHRDYEIVNSANGSNVVAMWRDTFSNNSQRGCLTTSKEVSFNIKDSTSNPVAGVKMYCQDNPSPHAKNATIAVATTQGVYTKSPTLLNGTLNADGTITYNYADPFTYSGTTNANGIIPKIKITTSAQIREFNAQDSAALASNGGPYNIPSFNVYWRESDNLGPAYTDWDTDRFGGFYRVDRRSNDNTAADEFTFKLASYEHGLTQTTQALKGVGEMQVSWVMFDDALITADRATADGYSEITTPQAFYNRAKAFLVDNYAGETTTIVSREGTTINAGSYNVTIDASASEVFAFDGSTITIKATQFVGSITGSGTFTLLNGAEVVGTFGGTTVYSWEVSNVEAGSTLQIFNTTQDIEIENLVVSGTAGTKVTASGTYATSEAVPGDAIRLRLTCQAGTSALLPFETVGVATASGVSFRADQQPDTIYNANNIDGSSISGITLTPDYTNIQIDLDDQEAPYELSAQAIYNYYAYLITTQQGIANFYGAITPVDQMNYRINASVVPLKIQNTGSTDVVLNGGRLYRDDNVSVLDTGAGSGTGSIMQDTGFLVQYIQPQVGTALSSYGVATATGLTATETALKKKITQSALI